MTIDLSQLSQEKRAFLKAHPDLLKSLKTGIGKQAVKVQTRKQRETKGKSKLQRELEDIDRRVKEARDKAEELRRKYDPHLRRIQNNLMMKLNVETGMKGLVCPVCGRSDEECGHNKTNGKPWCVKCDTQLIPKNKLKKWRKMVKAKAVRSSLKDEFKRRGLDF